MILAKEQQQKQGEETEEEEERMTLVLEGQYCLGRVLWALGETEEGVGRLWECMRGCLGGKKQNLKFLPLLLNDLGSSSLEHAHLFSFFFLFFSIFFFSY